MATKRKDEIHFAIKDTGSGIHPECLGRLLRSFSQMDNLHTCGEGGYAGYGNPRLPVRAPGKDTSIQIVPVICLMHPGQNLYEGTILTRLIRRSQPYEVMMNVFFESASEAPDDRSPNQAMKVLQD